MSTHQALDEERMCELERDLRLRTVDDAEILQRHAHLRAGMREHGLDALLLTAEPNVVYTTGLSVPSFVTPSRPLFVLLPAAEDVEPVLVCSRSQSANARSSSSIQQIAPFERFEPDAVEVVRDVAHQLGVARGRIGCEIGAEQRLGMTVLGFRRLCELLDGAEFTDGGPAIWRARQVKGPAEIARLRRAGALNAAAMDTAMATAAVGRTEREVRDVWATTLAGAGADRPGYLAVHSGPDNYRRISSNPTDRRLEEGDLLWMDGGPVVRGYWSDITRMVSIGPARPEDRERYAIAWQVVNELAQSVRPGITTGDLARQAARIFKGLGREMGGAARIGHGIGLELTEPPSLVDGDETKIVPNMTLAVETGIAAWDGYFLHEQNLVVTEDGSQPLAPSAPAQLLEV